MKYVQLANNSYMVHTSKGMKPFNDRHLNFSKLVEALRNNSPEQIIIELLKNPPTPDGIFTAYEHNKTNTLIYSISIDNSVNFFNVDKSTPCDVSNMTFLGVYASLQELFTNHPSYLI